MAEPNGEDAADIVAELCAVLHDVLYEFESGQVRDATLDRAHAVLAKAEGKIQ